MSRVAVFVGVFPTSTAPEQSAKQGRAETHALYSELRVQRADSTSDHCHEINFKSSVYVDVVNTTPPIQKNPM